MNFPPSAYGQRPSVRTHAEREGCKIGVRVIVIIPGDQLPDLLTSCGIPKGKLGLAGEILVLKEERRRLTAAGHPDLAEAVVHVSVIEGDGAGYDIKSFDDDGHVRHLEVKTTRGSSTSGSYVSPNEVAFSEAHPNTFVLVRVFGYDDKTKSGSCYRCIGSLAGSFALTPSQYRALPNP